MLKRFSYQIGCILAVTSILVGFSLKAEAEAVEQFPIITDSFLLAENPKNAGNPKISALDLFRKVYESRYTWNEQFPGYTAAVEFSQGKNKHKGSIRVNPDLSVEVNGIDDKEASQSVKNQLLMLVIHRRRTPFEVTHKNKAFKYGTTANNGAVEIIADSGKAQDRYQIANNEIVQVSRLLGPHAVVVKTLDTEKTSEGYIATQYQSTFQDPQTKQIIGSETSSDTYEKVGDYYLPVRQVIQHTEDGDTFEARVDFTQVRLIQPR